MPNWFSDASQWVESFQFQPGTPKDAGKEIKQNLDAAVLELLGDVSDKGVLDVGAGCGVLAKKLLERGAKVVLVDADLLQLMLARAYIGPNQRAVYICGDSESRPLKDVDLAVCQEVLEHLVSPKGTVESVMAQLKPGGTAVFSAPHLSTEEHDDFRENANRPKACLTVGGPAYTFDHLRTFTEETFKALLGEVEEMRVVKGKDDKGAMHVSVVGKCSR